MNEIEERNNLNSEESTQSTPNSNISIVDDILLESIILSIRDGNIPTITRVEDESIPTTYSLEFNHDNNIDSPHIFYVSAYQYSRITEELENHYRALIQSTTSLSDNENSSPLSEEEEELLAQVMEEVHNEIPTNSGSLLINESTSRFSSAIWYEAIQKKTIILAGVGGIGGFVAFLLARMKPTALFIYDPDIVETANMSGQLYSIEDIGNPKVSAISGMISKYCDYNSVYAISERFGELSDASDIMICGFDNMAARKTFFNKWLDHVRSKSETEKANCLFIDGKIKC